MRGEPCACMMQAHALAYGRTHTPTYTHVQPRIRPLASTRAHLYANAHPRTPTHTLMHTHACLHVRSRMPMMRPHTLVGSHATARALRIRTQAHRQPPRVHVCAHVRLAPTLCAHESRPYAYARMGVVAGRHIMRPPVTLCAVSRLCADGAMPYAYMGATLCATLRNWA